MNLAFGKVVVFEAEVELANLGLGKRKREIGDNFCHEVLIVL